MLMLPALQCEAVSRFLLAAFYKCWGGPIADVSMTKRSPQLLGRPWPGMHEWLCVE